VEELLDDGSIALAERRILEVVAGIPEPLVAATLVESFGCSCRRRGCEELGAEPGRDVSHRDGLIVGP